MINEDTIKLLRECNAGIKMGVTSIDDVLPMTKSEKLMELLKKCKDEHEKLGDETHVLLNEYEDSEKDPNPVAKVMSWITTNVKLMLNPTDKEVAHLMTDGCNMGVKSLNEYLNKYEAAEEKVKDITKRLINLEGRLAEDIRSYL